MSTRRVKLNQCITKVYETCSECNGKRTTLQEAFRNAYPSSSGIQVSTTWISTGKFTQQTCPTCKGAGEVWHIEGQHNYVLGNSEIEYCKCGDRYGDPSY